MNKYSYSRRDFIKISSLGALASLPILSLPLKVMGSSLISENKQLPVFIFSKHLQFLNYLDMSEAAKEMGFNGIDLTVRPKGHVLPERVANDLPKATEAMQKFGLSTKMIATSIKDASDETSYQVLEAASKLGYEYYRTGWFKYKKENDIYKQYKNCVASINDLAKLNTDLGISGSYHNHSGHYFGSSIWDLYQALNGISPMAMGSQYDIMHNSVDGGKNWEIGFNLIKKKINTLVVKDFIWSKNSGIWKPQFTPLGEGMIDFKSYFKLLKQNNIIVPLSIHVEYDLGGAEHGGKPTIDQKEVFARIKKDLDFVKTTWNEA